MKSKCSFILKASTALVLAMLVLFGSIATVVGAVAPADKGESDIAAVARKVADIADTGAKVDLAETGASQRYIYVGISNNYQTYKDASNYGFNFWGGTSGGVKSGTYLTTYYWDGRTYYMYRVQVYDDNNKAQFKGNKRWYDPSDGFSVTLNGTTNNAVFFSHSNDGWGGQFQQNYQETSTASLAATKTSMTTSESSTLTPSLSSNSTYNAIKSTSYSVTTNPGSGGSVTSAGVFTATKAGTYTVTATVTYNPKSFTGITKTATATKSITVTQAATTYTSIAAEAKGSTDGSTFNTTLSGTPATISANSYTTGSSALNISAGTVSDYTFYKWVVTAGSGTIGSATTANTTFTPSASNTTVTAQYKKNYTISKNTPTGGSVALSTTSAVAGDSYTVTLTPNDGYKVKSLTLNGNAVTVSNNKYTGTASGTSDTLAFVATFEANTAMKLYIAGRFHVKASNGNWVNTFDSGDWNATSTKIPFTYLSGTTYKVDTNATLAELSGKISNYDPVFFVYDTTNSKNWYASSATTMSTSGTTLVSSGGANSNLKFSSTSTDGPVTVYYDSNTHKIWYSIPNLYNVTVNNPATGGSVTASPSRTQENATVTLTITPSSGYQLSSITAKDSSNAAVTLSGTGNTRTFTMPAKNVTVTPVFEKITWSGLTAVGKYSTTAANDASYSNAMSPNPVTIAATSATQIDGVAVSAPATDPTGYVFAGWYTTTGSFANAANKDTIFKPNAADAVAIAKYKKIFEITYSVDNTGTGAGTVSTDKTEVEAGGSYTITATAKSGSAVESVKVNGTAKNATASQMISSVSANQTVVVKFAAKPHVIGKVAAAGWTEPGDAMKSNADGTEFTYTRTELAAGTYDFQHYIGTGTGGTYDSTSTDIATKTISGDATLSSVSNGYGGKKFQLVLTAKSDVTLVSNGSKFTAITVRRSGESKFNVTIYAKDGAIRSDSFGETYANIADTKIYAANGTTTVGTKYNGRITNQTYETYKAAKGDTVVIKTQIGATDSSTLSNAADLKAKYYVRGFCINGEVTELLEHRADGLYTLTYKIPEDIDDGTKIEITPIYYLKDTSANPIVTYRVTGFTDELKAVGAGKPGWGDTLYTYPYYGKLGGQNNAFGAYPGQPMVYYKGQYQMQIPQKDTAWDPYYSDANLSGSNNAQKLTNLQNTPVSGVTMSNGYWDSVHKQIMGYGDNSTSADHVQTYDYGDFYKIFNEKKPVDNIVFDFKYRTKKHNFENQPDASTTKSTLDTNYGTNGNGFELLTNFHGRTVDLFGTSLSGDAADPSKTTPVYVVSIGGVNGSKGVENIAGYFATEWMVYGSSNGTNYSRISAGDKNSIPPEVLVLNNNSTSFNNTTYPSADANHTLTQWKELYTALEAYRNHPVMISYEAADAQQGQGKYYTGTGGATRNDGRWLYSTNGESITSKIRIDVSHDSGATYVTNPEEGETGHVDGLSAYFTNADAYQQMTYATTIDPDKTFDMEAKTSNSSYKFVGWYMDDGTKITSDNVTHTERSGSYTFVACFMEVTSGQLTLSHSVGTGLKYQPQDSGVEFECNGSGDAKISAVVTDAETSEVLRTFELSSSDITIPEKYIGNDKNYNITVTLEATAKLNTVYATTNLAGTDGSSITESRFFNPKTPVTSGSGKTTTYTFTFNVKDDLYNGTTQRTLALNYNSYFIQYQFNYSINFEFDDRNGQKQQMMRKGTLTPAEADEYVYKNDSDGCRYLKQAFVEKLAPHESNFGQNITWSFEDIKITNSTGSGSNYSYTIEHHFVADQVNSNKRNVTFKLPYAHTDGIPTGDRKTAAKADSTNFALSGDNAVDFNTIPKLLNNAVNGVYTEDGKKNWIVAPTTLIENGNSLAFLYWSVKTTDHATAEDPDVARCYYPGFNFVAYDNYVIEPIYGVDNSTAFTNSTNITFITTTRNQWNSAGTDYAKTDRSHAADLLYNDFIVSYNYDNKEIHKGEANDDIDKLGIVVERVQKLYEKQDGSLDTTISRYTDITVDEEKIKSVINGTNVVPGISNKVVSTDSLDNKDRIQLYDAFYNSAGWKQNTTGGLPAQLYAYKNYIFRAYSYIKLKSGEIILSSPAYFTMYDVASANYEAPKSN